MNESACVNLCAARCLNVFECVDVNECGWVNLCAGSFLKISECVCVWMTVVL